MLLSNLSLNPSELPTLREIPHHGHPEKFKKELMLLTYLRTVPLIAAPVILYFFDRPYIALGALIVWLILFVVSVISVHKSFPVRGYALRELDISYKKGWIFFSHITIPFNRVQHSEISQGPIDRMYGLVTLHIYTAGGSSSDLSIPGLERDEAQRLRDFISAYHD